MVESNQCFRNHLSACRQAPWMSPPTHHMHARIHTSLKPVLMAGQSQALATYVFAFSLVSHIRLSKCLILPSHKYWFWACIYVRGIWGNHSHQILDYGASHGSWSVSFNHLTWPMASEDLIKFSDHKNFKLNFIILKKMWYLRDNSLVTRIQFQPTTYEVHSSLIMINNTVTTGTQLYVIKCAVMYFCGTEFPP